MSNEAVTNQDTSRASGLLSSKGGLIWRNDLWSDLPEEFGSPGESLTFLDGGKLIDRSSTSPVRGWSDFVRAVANDACFDWIGDDGVSRYRVDASHIAVPGESSRYLLNVARIPTQDSTYQVTKRTQALFEAARAFATSPGSHTNLYQMVAMHVAAGVGDVCVIRMLSPDEQFLEIAAIEGLGSEEIATYESVFPARNGVHDGVVGYVLASGEVARYGTSSPPQEISPVAKASLERMRHLGVHNVLIAPIRSTSRTIGTIGVMRNRTEAPFSRDEEDFVRELAQLAALSIESISLRRELQSSAEQESRFASQMQEIAKTSVEITRNSDLDSVFEIVTRRSREIIGAHMAVTSFTINQNWSQAIVTTDLSEKYAYWRDFDGQPQGQGIYTLVCSENRPYRLTQEDLVNHPGWRGFSEFADTHPPIRGWLAAPLTSSDGSNLGLLQVSDRYEGDFTETDEAVLVQLAQVAGSAIEKARLNDDVEASFKRIEDHARRLEILSEITKVLVAAPLDPHAIARQAAIQVGEMVGDTCIIRFLSEDGEYLDPAGVYHPDAQANDQMWTMLKSHRHRAGEGLAGSAIQSGETILISEIDPAQATNHIDDPYKSYLSYSEFHSSLVTPLIARGRIIGSLGLSRTMPGRSYTEADSGLIESIAGLMALAVDNGFLFAGESRAREMAQNALYSRDLAMVELERLNNELEDRVRERTTQLVSVNGELEAFAYSVTHDLRAPLRAIDGYSLAVIEDYGDTVPDRARLYLDRVRSASQRMGNIINDLLRLSRLSQSDLNLRPIDLTSVARDVFAEVLGANSERQIDIQIEEGMQVVADEHLLRLALQNLLGNAVKFSRDREIPRIECGCMPEDETVHFVKDNGAGFDMEYADKMFRPFQRLHTEHEFEGTGIGLAIAQRIFNRHGGSLWAESIVDRGATFYFSLAPAIEEENPDA